MSNERITLDDSMMSAIMKLSEGNPGAMNVCIKLVKEAPDIDTDDVMGGLGTLLMMDSYQIYGAKIWMLYKDVCKEELWKMIAVLRASQLGFLSSKDLHYGIENYGNGINMESLIKRVTETLPGFKTLDEN
jgi:hypothetical protein